MFSDLMRLFGLLLIVFIFLPAVFAVDFKVNITPQDVLSGSEYNFTINFNNTNSSNVTRVNVTLPSSLSYIEGSNGSSVDNNFTVLENILSWEGIFTNSTIETLKFNASASSDENMTYNVTVHAYYSDTVQYDNVTVSVNTTELKMFESNLTPNSTLSGINQPFVLELNNTNILNITKVTVSFPDFLTFIEGTNISTVNANFSNTTSNLTWVANFTKSNKEILRFNMSTFSTENLTGEFLVKVQYDHNSELSQNKTFSINITNSSTENLNSDDYITLQSPLNGSKIKTGNINFTCYANDTIEMDKITIYLGADNLASIGSQNATDGENSVTITKSASLGSHGTYYWNCQSLNVDGVSRVSNDYVLYVDGQGPSIVYNDPTPINNASINDTIFTINVTGNEDILRGNITLIGDNSTVVSNDIIQVNGKNGNYTVNDSNLSDGYYKYKLVLFDQFNNSQTHERGIFIDTVKPSLGMSSMISIVKGSSRSVLCSGSDEIDDSLDFTYSLYQLNSTNKSVLNNGTKIGSNVTIEITSNLTQNIGKYYLECSVKDNAGNVNRIVRTYNVISGSTNNNQQNNNVDDTISWESGLTNLNDILTFNVGDQRIPIRSITVKVNEPVNGVNLELIKRDRFSTIPSPPGILYGYIEVLHENLLESNINETGIQFNVASSWVESNSIDPDSVKLYRYFDGWNQLDTVREEVSSGYIVYMSDSPGLSKFAITGQLLQESDSNSDVNVDNDTDNVNIPRDSTFDDIEDEESGSFVIVILFLLIIGGLIGATVWYLNRKGVFVVMTIPDKNKN